MGAVMQEFEKEFAQYLGVKYAFAVSNGTAAFRIACQAMESNKVGGKRVC
jgi:dTDP-4-amino-4,6-dideoxygalactose transaminase